jgi:restriction system protein
MADQIIWGIHAGKTGDADKLFMSQNVIAVGWQEVGDLGTLHGREDFKKKYLQTFPGTSAPGVANSAGQLFRFVREMKTGELVAYPSRKTRTIHIGRITGDYRYPPDLEASYPNQRTVEWLKEVPRTALSNAALLELGAAMSVFQVRNYATEVLALTTGTAPVQPVLPEAETPGGIDADEAEQLTRDFILKRLAQELKGLPFEELVRQLLIQMGYRVRMAPVNEPSVDLIAHRDELGLEPPIIKVQVKSGDGTVADKDVSALAGKLGPSEYGLVVCLSTFSPTATSYASGRPNLRLIDGNQLVDLLLQHYDDFDPKYKAIIPLRRVFIPELPTEG